MFSVRGVQKNPYSKPNLKYPKTRIRNIRNFGYPKIRISENRIIRSFGFGFGFGCEFLKISDNRIIQYPKT
ncbi:hypothetical protein Hanom_Chr16g01488541 [Helianthus anomalus]